MKYDEIEIPRKYLRYRGIVVDPNTFEPKYTFTVHNEFISYIKENYKICGSYVDNHEITNFDPDLEVGYITMDYGNWDLSIVDEETSKFFNILDNKPYKLYFKMTLVSKDVVEDKFTPVNIKTSTTLNVNSYGYPFTCDIETDAKNKFSISNSLSVGNNINKFSINLTSEELTKIKDIIDCHLEVLKEKKIISTTESTDIKQNKKYKIDIKEI